MTDTARYVLGQIQADAITERCCAYTVRQAQVEYKPQVAEVIAGQKLQWLLEERGVGRVPLGACYQIAAHYMQA